MACFLGTAASLLLMISALQEKGSRNGNPVVKNPCFHCKVGCRFDPWVGN